MGGRSKRNTREMDTKGERLSLRPIARKGECVVRAHESAQRTSQETIMLFLSKTSTIHVGKKLGEVGPLPA